MKHPEKSIEKRVAVVGCKHTTRDLIAGLARANLYVDHCLTLEPAQAQKAEVAGYYDLRPFLDEQNIPYTLAHKYTLKSDEDREHLLALDFDILLVMGWQRLIPEWWLEALSIGAFGMHGSNKPLPHGRGRSPMNWSLIQNKRLFFTHLFRYRPGVDDGDIVGVQLFDITPFDTAHTLHFKNLTAMIRLLTVHLPRLMDGSAKFRPQPDEEASYYPKRGAEDGLIYWRDATFDIYNLIRAVTKPFPGAFSYLNDNPEAKVVIWRAIPFDSHLTWEEARAGQIVQVFYDNSFIVKTGDTSLLVLEYEGAVLTEEHIGQFLGTLNTPRKVWENLPY